MRLIDLLKEAKYSFSDKNYQTLKNKSNTGFNQTFPGGIRQVASGLNNLAGLVGKVSNIERPYQDQLISIAQDILSKQYPIIGYGQIVLNLSYPNQAQGEQPGQPPRMVPAQIPNANPKRKTVNAVTQGAAVKGTRLFHLIREAIEEISTELPQLYSELAKLTVDVYGNDQIVEMAKEMYRMVPDDNSDNSENGAGKVFVEWVEEEQTWHVNATGVTLIFILHEAVKGIYEVISLTGTKPDDGADHPINEPEDLQIGPQLYDLLNNLFIQANTEDTRVRELLFSKIYSLDDDSFSLFMDNLIEERLTSQQQQFVNNSIKDIVRDLLKYDADMEDWQNGGDEGQIDKDNRYFMKKYGVDMTTYFNEIN